MAEFAFVTIANFTTLTEAIVAKASLEAAGVECMIPNENTIRIRGAGALPGMGPSTWGVQLQVSEVDVAPARDILGLEA